MMRSSMSVMGKGFTSAGIFKLLGCSEPVFTGAGTGFRGAEGAPDPVGKGAGTGFTCSEPFGNGAEEVLVPVGRGAGVGFTGAVEVPALVIGDTSGTLLGFCASPAPVVLSLFAALSFSSVSMTSFSRTVTPWSWAIRLAMASTSIDVP